MSLQGVRGVVLVGGWLIGRVVIDSSPLAVRFLGVRPGGWSVPSVSGWFCGVAAPSVSDCLLVWVLFWGLAGLDALCGVCVVLLCGVLTCIGVSDLA